MDRKGFLGGTDLAAIMGKHPYRSPMQVYAEKLDLTPPWDGNEATWAGNMLEPHIADWYAKEHEIDLMEPGKMVDPKVTYFAGHPDRLTPDGTVVEIKTAGFNARARWGEPLTDEIPSEYLMQCQWYMMLSQAKRAHVAVAFLQKSKEIYVVDRNDALIKVMREAGQQFWEDHVTALSPPEATDEAIDSQKTALSQIFPGESDATYLQANSSVDTDLMVIKNFEQQIKDLKAQKDAAEGRVMRFIGGHAGVESFVGRADWKLVGGRPSYKKCFDDVTVTMDPSAKKNLMEASRGKSSRRFKTYWAKGGPE